MIDFYHFIAFDREKLVRTNVSASSINGAPPSTSKGQNGVRSADRIGMELYKMSINPKNGAEGET